MAMSGEDQPLVTNEPVKLDKEPVKVQDFMKITNHFRRNYEIHFKLIKKNRKTSTCSQLNLEILHLILHLVWYGIFFLTAVFIHMTFLINKFTSIVMDDWILDEAHANYQGLTNNFKYTLQCRWQTTRAIYNMCWARQKELVTLHTIFSVGSRPIMSKHFLGHQT